MNSSLPQYWEHFDFDHDQIEHNVDKRLGSYQGLSPLALYTSREDFITIFSHPLVSGTFVDLGCGTGESCLLYGTLFNEKKAIGLEFQKVRLDVGLSFMEKFKISNVDLFEVDLMTCSIPHGDTYFLYFSTGPVLDRILTELYQTKRPFKMVIIESHGDLIPRLKKENWLKEVGDIPLNSQRHHGSAIIYESLNVPRRAELLPHMLSFIDRYLVVEDKETWVGDSFGLEWNKESIYELKTPPRTINWGQVREVKELQEFPEDVKLAIELRRLGELTINTSQKTLIGKIRKIITEPSFHLEISTGEKVQWSEITSICQGNKKCYDFSWEYLL